MNINPCQLGPIHPGHPLFGRPRVRAACGCGVVFTAWDDAQLRDLYAEHLTVPVPPAEVLAQDAPTVADVKAWPDFFMAGPGRAVAQATECPHAYHLTDSCPGCDHDEEQAATR